MIQAPRSIISKNLIRNFSTAKPMVAREIIDSRGNPTVEVDCFNSDNTVFRASVPSGASTGVHEAVELRDKDPSRYLGKGVLKAVSNVNNIISPLLADLSSSSQEDIDNAMLKLDNTPNKSSLGANAILGASLASAKANAHREGLPLYSYFSELMNQGESKKFIMPVPAFNVLNGGSHAGNKLAFQEFMIMPVGASSFSQAMEMGCVVYHNLKSIVVEKYGIDASNVGDEGGLAPNIQSNIEGCELLVSAIEKSGYSTDDIKIAMDVASSEFYNAETKLYNLDFKNPNFSTESLITGEELKDLYKTLIKDFPIVSIEDPFDQDDWESYSSCTKELGSTIQIVGDDLLCTNPTRIAKAIETSACNALLLKLNQIGSVTEAMNAVKMSQEKGGWGVMTSHRSGETEDTTIADVAVGWSTGQIKTGAPCRSERLAKYNRLLRIEEELAGNSIYAGRNFRNPLL